MVLVDSSVWIEYLRNGKYNTVLEKLIESNLVCVNEIILTELLPFLVLDKQFTVAKLLENFPLKELDIHWKGIQLLQTNNLKKGINKIGIPDLIIVQQCLDQNLELFTQDKHFKLMSKYYNLTIFEH
jgi:predicted nucleic acid-binding protein